MKILRKGFKSLSIKKRIELLRSFTDRENNYTDITCILDGTESTTNHVYDKVSDWLDANCSNGYHSRWTSHGNNIMTDAELYIGECLVKGLLV